MRVARVGQAKRLLQAFLGVLERLLATPLLSERGVLFSVGQSRGPNANQTEKKRPGTEAKRDLNRSFST